MKKSSKPKKLICPNYRSCEKPEKYWVGTYYVCRICKKRNAPHIRGSSMAKDWKGKRIAKEVYVTNKIPYAKGETYETLDHYLVACPDCGAELTIKLFEKLSNPDHIHVVLTHAKHKK